MTDIKECPFCGGDGELIQRYNSRYGNYFVFVACGFCNAQGKIFNSESDWEPKTCEKAVTAWNMRYKGE